MPGVTFTEGAAQKIARATRIVLGPFSASESYGDSFASLAETWFWGKIKATGPDSEPDRTGAQHWFVRCDLTTSSGVTGTATFAELDTDDPRYIYSVLTNVGTAHLPGMMAHYPLRPGQIVKVFLAFDSNSPVDATEHWFCNHPVPTPYDFPIRLEMVAGSDGTNTTMASWRYNIKDILTGEVLTEDQDPQEETHDLYGSGIDTDGDGLFHRPLVGSMVPATAGTGRWVENDGTPYVQIVDCNEREAVKIGCVAP